MFLQTDSVIEEKREFSHFLFMQWFNLAIFWLWKILSEHCLFKILFGNLLFFYTLSRKTKAKHLQLHAWLWRFCSSSHSQPFSSPKPPQHILSSVLWIIYMFTANSRCFLFLHLSDDHPQPKSQYIILSFRQWGTNAYFNFSKTLLPMIFLLIHLIPGICLP